MEMNESDLTCYCGLYCGDCIRYKSTASELAASLLKEFEKTQFEEYAQVKSIQIPDFRHYETMVSILNHITRLQCGVPCRLGGDGCGGTSAPLLHASKTSPLKVVGNARITNHAKNLRF